MKIILLTISLHLFALLSSAQITFQKTYGGIGDEQGNSVQQTYDGGYIIAGFTTSSGTGYDAYLVKTNAFGDTLWTKSYGGLSFDDCSSVQQTSDSGFIFVGNTSSFSTPFGGFYVIKTDSNGNIIWSKVIEAKNVKAMQLTFDGGCIVTGEVSYPYPNSDIFLLKTDAVGNILWNKHFDTTGGETSYSISQTFDGGFIIAGGTTIFNPGFLDIFLLKTDSTGSLSWSKTFGGMNIDDGKSVQQTSDGGFIVVGHTQSFQASWDIYLIKTDANGDIQWTKTFGGAIIDYGYSVQQSSDNGYIIAGATSSFGSGGDLYLLKTDSLGSELWSKSFGGINYEYGRAVNLTNDGGFIVTGYFENSAGTRDIYLIKMDINGLSGCNETIAATLTGTPVTQDSIPTSVVSADPTSVVNAVFTTGSINSMVDTFCTSVGINLVSDSNLPLLIYPNPTVGKFSISYAKSIKNGNVKILNILGENVYVENIINEFKKEINLKYIPAGIYVVIVFDGEKSSCDKLIINHGN